MSRPRLRFLTKRLGLLCQLDKVDRIELMQAERLQLVASAAAGDRMIPAEWPCRQVPRGKPAAYYPQRRTECL